MEFYLNKDMKKKKKKKKTKLKLRSGKKKDLAKKNFF